jgi:DNA-binding NarL/FixJ family response regulator
MRIVLVEDNDDLRAEIVEYFRRRRHEVVDCRSIADATRRLEEMLATAQAPDAIICDIGLPDGNGARLYDAYAERTRSARWLLMSGGHDVLVADLPGLPPDAIVDKPVSFKVLEQLLQRRPAT